MKKLVSVSRLQVPNAEKGIKIEYRVVRWAEAGGNPLTLQETRIVERSLSSEESKLYKSDKTFAKSVEDKLKEGVSRALLEMAL